MLIARAPLRISFAGGGTDLPAYYRQFGGMVVSAAIDKYVYVVVSPNGNGSLQVTSANYKSFLRHSLPLPIPLEGDLKHARAALNVFGLRSGYSIFMASEVAPGTGLGSSSAAAVALGRALDSVNGSGLDKVGLAEWACHLELDVLGMPIGKQDQYASSFGGINAIYFDQAEVRVEPLALSESTYSELQRHLMLFLTRLSHDSTAILREQEKKTERGQADVVHSLHALRAAAEETRAALLEGDVHRLGAILHETWQQKKHLARGITNPLIDRAYDAAIKAGAVGGKITGAGGGGFLLLYCPPARQDAVTRALQRLGLERFDFHFDHGGAAVVANDRAHMAAPGH